MALMIQVFFVKLSFSFNAVLRVVVFFFSFAFTVNGNRKYAFSIVAISLYLENLRAELPKQIDILKNSFRILLLLLQRYLATSK